jgi:hypothetical protein
MINPFCGFAAVHLKALPGAKAGTAVELARNGIREGREVGALYQDSLIRTDAPNRACRRT